MRTLTLQLVLIFLYPRLGWGKTVVMVPGPGKSYILYHARIAEALTELGHDVWMCMSHNMTQRGLVKNKSIHILSYRESIPDLEQKMESSLRGSNMFTDFWEGKSLNFDSLKSILKVVEETGYEIMSDDDFQKQILGLKPDLMVLEEAPALRNMVLLPYKFDIPFAWIGTAHNMILSRVPFSPAVETNIFSKDTHKKQFWQRLKSTFEHVISMYYDPFSDNSFLSKYAPEKPYKTISEIALQAEVFISEMDHILDYPKPTLPNTKLIGGSSATEPKPLSGQFKQFVEQSKNEVVIVTFGGNDFPVPEHIVLKMMSAFEQLPLSVVWRMNTTSLDPNQILTSTWIPQNDLLGHPKTKVFVSHCGKNGQYEALYHAVPILCLPIYGDQFYNTERVQAKGFGVGRDIREISVTNLADTIQELANDGKYKRNIQKASNLFKELYKVPSKEAAYWIDHVMKYGGDYMRSSGQEMPLYQFLILDVLGCVVVVVIFTCTAIIMLARFCYRKVLKQKHYKQKTL
ncbi:UDP-glucuronosyltransferase 1-2-like [Physella acuta]|uniref:UDP-glucuronosyltransferase 1-2-like n=1 Tax=Physella acuta TaxID=109671 RepID=UPI0027DCC560|nr:UDP-glucuronosyltransferase 1-2-like [Physella acuta]